MSCAVRKNASSRSHLLFICLSLAAFASWAPGRAWATKSTENDDTVEAKLRFSPTDEAGNDLKAVHAEILIQKSEKKALVQLQRLVKQHKGDALEADLLFHLAELYMRRARSERFFEAHRDSEIALRFAPDVVKDASEAAEIRGAIKIYEDLQARFPKFRSLDVAIFNEAFAQEQLGQMNEAENLFLKITSRYSKSYLSADSWLALGEISYQRRGFTQAHERFLKVRAYEQSQAYPYALYKAAWCLYNLQDAGGAMKQLEEVIAFGHDAALSWRDAKLDLRKEALGDLSLFYGDVLPASTAVAYFEKQAQELDPAPYVMRLVETYDRHSRYPDVEATLKDFLAKHPDSFLAAGAHEKLVWNFERQQKRAEAIAELETFYQFCAVEKTAKRAEKDRPAKAALNKSDSKLGRKGKRQAVAADPPAEPTMTCHEKVADSAKKLAGKWHALWKKRTPTDDLAASAEKAYAIYLRLATPTSADAAPARFAYAELLFQRKKYREASAQYAMAAALKPPQPLMHDAGYGAIVSLEQAAEEKPASGKWSDADEAKFVALSDAYLKANPKATYALDVRFKRGFIAYEKERYDEAAVAFKTIGWGPYAASEKKTKAQDLYLDILNLRKNYRGLKEAARGLLDQGPEADPKRRESIEKVYRQAYFAEIQGLEEKGSAKAAIEAYQKFALENRSSELAPKAWWNSSQLMFKSGDAEGGAKACYQMHQLFPAAEGGKDCLTKAAQTFEAMGRLDLAARVLLNLAIVEPASEEKWRELAADFFALSGSRARAVAMYEKLGEGKPAPRKLALLEKTEQLAKTAGDSESCRKARSQIIALGIEPQAGNRSIEVAEETFAKGDQPEAFAQARRILGRSSVSKSASARARFLQAEVLEDEFQRQSVKARPERLALVLALKTEKLEKAQTAYQSSIRYGDARVSARSFRKLAGLYRSYAEALRAVPAPEGSSAKDSEAFKGEIERLALPLEEKGVETLAQALATAKNAGFHDGTVGEIQAEFDKANLKKPTDPAPAPSAPRAYVPQFAMQSTSRGDQL